MKCTFLSLIKKFNHDPNPYLKGQGHTAYLKDRVHKLVSAL